MQCIQNKSILAYILAEVPNTPSIMDHQ